MRIGQTFFLKMGQLFLFLLLPLQAKKKLTKKFLNTCGAKNYSLKKGRIGYTTTEY